MDTVEIDHNNGHSTSYMRLDNGTCYNVKTPAGVVEVLEEARLSHRRIRIFYGDQQTGRDWGEENDTIGTIGRSTGNIKVPLLLKMSRSYGGGALLDHCIVKITIDKRVRYLHPNYHQEAYVLSNLKKHGSKDFEWSACRFAGEGPALQPVARFKTKVKAENWIAFMKGERNSR